MWKHNKSFCKIVTTKLVFQYTFIMYDCITKCRSHSTAAETQPSSSLLCFVLNVMLEGKFDDVHDVQQEHAVFQSRRLLWICISWAKCGDRGVGEHLPAGSCNNLHCVNRDILELNKNPCTNTSGGRPSAGHQNVKNECYFSLWTACGSLLQTPFSVSVVFQHDTVCLLVVFCNKKKCSPV